MSKSKPKSYRLRTDIVNTIEELKKLSSTNETVLVEELLELGITVYIKRYYDEGGE